MPIYEAVLKMGGITAETVDEDSFYKKKKKTNSLKLSIWISFRNPRNYSKLYINLSVYIGF